jgi:hypothetical protein
VLGLVVVSHACLLAACPGDTPSSAAASADLASSPIPLRGAPPAFGGASTTKSSGDFAPIAVTYAEVIFGCQGSTPDTHITPGINLAPADGRLGEIRISGDAATHFSLAGQSIVYDSAPDHPLSLGTLAASPSCQVIDTGDPATPSWNAITLSTQVSMTLERVDGRYTLEMQDLTSAKRYSVSF